MEDAKNTRMDTGGDWRPARKPAAFKLPESLSRMAERYLETEIIEGRIPLGTRLNPEEIAKQLNISKSPVREALILLQREGLVAGKPRSVFVVSEINLGDIKEIYPIRASLNALAVKSILQSEGAAEVVERLAKILEKMKPKAAASDTTGYFHLSVEFYNCLIDSCPNQRLQTMWHQLSKQILRFRFLVMSQPGHIERSIKDHVVLVEAMRAGSVEVAMRCAENIIHSSLDDLIAALGPKEEGAADRKSARESK